MTEPLPAGTAIGAATGPASPSARARPNAGRSALVEPAIDDAATAQRLHDSLGRDLVYRYRLLPRPRFEYVSRTCIAMTGYTPEEHYADPDLGLRVIHPDDRAAIDAAIKARQSGPILLRWVRRDGTVIWVEHQAQFQVDEDGSQSVLEGIVRDVTNRVLAREGARAMQAGLWTMLEGAAGPGVMIDTTGRVVHVNERFRVITGWSADEVAGRLWTTLVREHSGTVPRVGASDPLRDESGASRHTPTQLALRDGGFHLVAWSTMALADVHGRPVGSLALGEDLTDGLQAAIRAAELQTAVAMSGESVVVTDTEARIVYVNGAFERSTGYRMDEVVGKNPRILQSGHQSTAFYRVMWLALGRGRTWHGELVNRRKDGRLLIEEAAISPVTGADGTVVAYVASKRDVTRMRQLRANLDDAHRQRELLATALDALKPRVSAGETCDDLAAILCELPGSVAAGVALFDGGPVARFAALRTTTPLQISQGFALPDISDMMLRHAEQVAWIEPVIPDGSPEVADATEAGIHAVLVVPVRHEGMVLGVLVVGGADPTGADLRPQMAAATQVATVARSLLAPHVASQLARAQVRERIGTTIEEQAFRVVFQPIVDLYTGGVVGFEALARFDDLRSPEEHFAEAVACGMSEALELAAIEAAIAGAAPLAPTAMLTVNVSPDTILSPRLGDILRASTRPVVLEITEHAHVDDYEALRASLAALGPAVRIAVDDAGAGQANLHHLVQLRPDFVKLDISLVHGIDTDFTRQALVIGLMEFARVSGRALIAEGIETDLERTTLSELSVRFGQGYLLGAPAPAEAWAHVAIEDQDAFAADAASAAWETRVPAAWSSESPAHRRRRSAARAIEAVPAARGEDPSRGSGDGVARGGATAGWRRP